MRTVIFLVALSISDLAKSDLSPNIEIVAALFFLFFIMDIVELMK